MLVALGLGAFWFLTRHPAQGATYAGPVRGAGAAQTSGAVTGQLISQGGNLLGQLVKGWSSKSSGYAIPALFSNTPDYAPINIPTEFSSDGMTFDSPSLFGF